MSTTTVKCEECGNEFEKENKEINRCKKRGMKNFCGNSCSTSYNNKSKGPEYWKARYKNNPVLIGYENNRLDELSPFKYFLTKGRASMAKHTTDIDAEYLKSLWESQNGICPYTGIKMILPASSANKDRNIKSLKKASLDRIDSTLEYIKGNVEFVCMGINFAKNNYSKDETMSFINEIVSHKKSSQV